jgi:hypothetical protein
MRHFCSDDALQYLHDAVVDTQGQVIYRDTATGVYLVAAETDLKRLAYLLRLDPSTAYDRWREEGQHRVFGD